MSKLTVLHISIIGAVVSLILAVGMYFTLITNATDDMQKAKKDDDDTVATAATLPDAKKQLKKAQDDMASAKRDYAGFETVYMPSMHYTPNPITYMMDYWWPNHGKSIPERFRHDIAAYMNAERKRNGIIWQNSAVTMLPPYGPDPSTIAFGRAGETFGKVHHFDYEMQVEGPSMPALMRHVRNWPAIAQVGVPVVDGVTVSGNSPHLQMTYNLTLTIIERSGETPPKTDPRIAGTNAGNGNGGGFGGRPGGGFGSGGMMGVSGMGAPRMGGPMGPPSYMGSGGMMGSGAMMGGGGRPMGSGGGMMSGGAMP